MKSVAGAAILLSTLVTACGTPTQPSGIEGAYDCQITPSSTCNAKELGIVLGSVPLAQSGAAVSIHFTTGAYDSLDLTGRIAGGALLFSMQARSTVSVALKQANGTGMATIAGDQINGTFVGDLTYSALSIQLSCHATDHQLLLKRTR